MTNQTFADRKGSCSNTPYMFFPGSVLSWRPACYPIDCYGRTDWSMPDFFGWEITIMRLDDLVEDVSRPAMAKRPDSVSDLDPDLMLGGTMAIAGMLKLDGRQGDKAHRVGIAALTAYAYRAAMNMGLDWAAGNTARKEEGIILDQSYGLSPSARERKVTCGDCDGTGKYVGLMTKSDCHSCGGLGYR